MKSRKFTKKRTYRKRGRFARSVAKIAKRVVKNAGERKYYDINIQHNAATGGPVFSLMSQIAQGTGQNERIGDRILLKSFYCQASVLMNSTAGQTKYRLLIVRQKGQAGGTAPSVSDILLPHTSLLRVNSAVDTDKFTIVHDRTYLLDTDDPYRKVDFKIKFNTPLVYNDSLASPAREYYLVSISDAGILTPYIVGNLRMKYTDV